MHLADSQATVAMVHLCWYGVTTAWRPITIKKEALPHHHGSSCDNGSYILYSQIIEARDVPSGVSALITKHLVCATCCALYVVVHHSFYCIHFLLIMDFQEERKTFTTER